jgi:diphthamide biosynthesis enzyme Dph1/Dph2-like protein
MKLQEKYPDKTFYYLLADVIDFSKLEDFPFLQAFVNTACPRIIDDTEKVPRPMVNIEDLGTVW